MSENKLIAEVNGVKIYQEDLFNLLSSIEDKNRFNSKEGLNILADELVNQELLLQDAKENKLDNEEEFAKELEIVKNNMLKNYAMHKIFEKVSVSEDEIKNYYEENKDALFSPVTYTASHILLENEEMADKVMDEINKGLDFKDAARKYSLDPTKDNGGSLGSFPRGVMVKEFQEGLDSLKIGEISKPIKTQFGYHIIKLDNKVDSSNTYDDIKDKVKSTYEMVKRQEKYIEKIKDLTKKAEINKYY
ncbi:peptidylprolyl isomerase [Anaerococcus sp. Marseille-P3625]|uniref:peptidylprolyl isomerase n=1 Tax=Anaerococcus sp. Marseille-P3625 TaxID=1977277 RepID=UPI000C06DC0F|nr:peptidylprolyl isomerase [Anaerococcus sp. Marseille-P3625]